ncbi:hypothetical protein VTJ49DRAFT_115 [Mycothermus thermophilus]|uniref:Uncharacterized protein n=1 Tax=Humicola insolens TaxID=85995 RepID=A0ABR3VP93_HUMIN
MPTAVPALDQSYPEGVDEENPPAFIMMPMVPHELTIEQLRLALRSSSAHDEETVDQVANPLLEDMKQTSRYEAERLTGEALTRAFYSMVEAQTTYGILARSDALIFLKIDWNDPPTLFYHFSEPQAEMAKQAKDEDGLLYCSYLSQVLAFALSTLESQKHKWQKLGG